MHLEHCLGKKWFKYEVMGSNPAVSELLEDCEGEEVSEIQVLVSAKLPLWDEACIAVATTAR